MIESWFTRPVNTETHNFNVTKGDCATGSLVLSYMLDTNLCIRVLSDRPQELRTWFNAEADAMCISTIMLAELLHGASKSARPIENRREVRHFTSRLEVLPFHAEAASHSAEIRTTLERLGAPYRPLRSTDRGICPQPRLGGRHRKPGRV